MFTSSNTIPLLCLAFCALAIGKNMPAKECDKNKPNKSKINGPSQNYSNPSASAANLDLENRTLAQIYAAALEEESKGPFIIYAGGSVKGQQDTNAAAFMAAFPNLTAQIVVDYSPFQAARINLQLENNLTLVPDAVQLQTLQNFPEWKEKGAFLQYKPANWSKVYEQYKDPDGFYTGVFVLVLSTVVNQNELDKGEWPRTAEDFLKPKFDGNLIVVHPQMDDAVLFYFYQVVQKYGWEFLANFSAQSPIYVCEATTQLSQLYAGTNGTVAISAPAVTAFANSSAFQFAFPAADDPFTGFAFYLGIFKRANRPETAKLFMNWMLQTEVQSSTIWSVRTDVQPLQGYKPIWEYGANTSHQKFAAFMANVGEREEFTRKLLLELGVTNCDQSPLLEGISPKTSSI